MSERLTTEPPVPRARGVGHVLAVAGATLGTALTFVGAVVGGALLHVGTPPARRVIVTQVNKALDDTFQGKIRIERINRFGLGGFEGISASVYDPEGRRVLHVEGMRAHIGLPMLAWAFLAGKGDVHIDLTEVRVDGAEALLEQDAEGQLSLVRAFAPKHPTKSNGSPRDIVVSLPHVEIGQGWVHGHVASFEDLNAMLHEVRGDFSTSNKETKLDLAPFALDARGIVPREIAGRVEGHLLSPAAGDLSARATFDGRAGDVLASVRAAVDGKKIDATADIPRTEAAALRELVPTAPIYDAASAHVEVHGVWPLLHPIVHVTIGDGEIDVKGDVTIGTDTVLDLTADAKNVNPRSFAPTAPASSITANVHSAVTIATGGAVKGTFALHSAPASVEGQVVPALDATGRFTQYAVQGHAIIHEEGAPTEMTFDLHPRNPLSTDGKDKVLDFDGKVAVNELANVRRIKRLAARGRVIARARGRVEIDKQSIDARVDAEVENVSRGDMSIGKGYVTARVFGPLKNVTLNAAVAAKQVKLGGRVFADVKATSTGPFDAPFVTATMEGGGMPRISVRAQLHNGGDFVIDGAMFEMWKDDVHLVAHVAKLRVAHGAIDAEGVTVEGIGSPITGAGHYDPARIAVRLKGDDIDLVSVNKLFGQLSGVKAGHASLDVDVTADKKAANGHVNAELKGGSFYNVDSANGRAAFQLSGRAVDGELDADLQKEGHVKVKLADVRLGGSPLDAATWRGITGRVDLDSSFGLGEIAKMLPMEKMPVSEVNGSLIVQAHVVRKDGRENPDVDLHVHTEKLTLVGKDPTPQEAAANANANANANQETTVTTPALPWHLEGLDVRVDARVVGMTGRTNVLARVFDTTGTLVVLSAKADLPLAKMERRPAQARALLEVMPLLAHVDVPLRAFDKYPEMARPPELRGSVGLAADLTGTAKAPLFALHAFGRGVQSTTSRLALPVDLDVTAKYDTKIGDAHLEVRRPEGVVLDVTTKVDAPIDVMLEKGADGPWTANTEVHFNRFPLEAIPSAADVEVSGKLNGTATLNDLHKDARFDARLNVAEMKLGGVDFNKAEIAATVHDGKVHASVSLARPDGYMDATVAGGMTWGAKLAPSFDDTKRVEATVLAKNFRAAALLPFVHDAFDDLDGRIDASAKIHLKEGLADGTMDGAVELSNGTMELPALGQELHDVHARIDIRPWGTVRIRQVRARGLSGLVQAEGTAKLDGFKLTQASGKIHIADRDRLPITVQGVPMGEASGDVNIAMKRDTDGKTVDIDVDIPKLHTELPHATGHSPQNLGDDPTIEVGLYRKNGVFVLLPLHKPETVRDASATHIHAVIHLGNDVLIKRGTEVRIALTGTPVVDVTDTTHVNGDIRLTSGLVVLQGKRFNLDNGIITFTGDASTPQLYITAYWDAPDGTRVYADVTGTPKAPKVVLRSEPAHSQNEILSLILFGTTEGSGGAQKPDQQSDPGGAAGGAVAGAGAGYVGQGITKMMSGVTDVQIQTKVDTSDAANPRPEIELQLSQRVMLEIIHNIGVPAPGQNPDQNLAVIDYRFSRRWTLQTTFGDRGSSLVDLLWQFRY